MAIHASDAAALGRAMDANFATRRRLFGDPTLGDANLMMVGIAQRHGGIGISALHQTGLKELLHSVENLLWKHGLPEYDMQGLAGLASVEEQGG